MAGTYIPPAAAGIRYDSLLSPRIVGAAEVTGSLCGCPGNNAVQGRAGFRLQSGQEWVYSLFAGHGTGCFRVFPFLEMLIVNGAPLYLLAAFLEWTASSQSYFISVRAESRRKLLSGILWAGTGFLAAYALLWFARGLFGIFFFGYADGITAWKMLLYAVIMKFLDTMGQYLVMMCVYAVSRQVTIGFLVPAAGNLLCVVPGQWVSYLPFGFRA